MDNKAVEYFVQVFDGVKNPKAEIEIGKILNLRRGQFSNNGVKETCILVCNELDFSYTDLNCKNRCAISSIVTAWCWWDIKRVSDVVSSVYENYLIGS